MIKKILAVILALQIALLADFSDVDAQQLVKLQSQNVPVIDIRTPGEWKETGVIPGAHKIMFFDERGNYNIQDFLAKLSKVVKDKNQPFILVCRTAHRTKTVGNFLSKQVGYKNVKELKGGMMYGWMNEGKKTVK